MVKNGAEKAKPSSHKNGSAAGKPVTEGRIAYLFADLKDFVRSLVKGSETVLRKEFKADIQILQVAATAHSKQIKNLDVKIDGVRTELKEEIRGVETRLNTRIDGVEQRLDAKIDGVEQRLDAKIDGVEQRLDAKIDGVETRLAEKIDRVGDKVENHETRITNLETVRV